MDPRVFVACLQWNKAGASAVKTDLLMEESGGKFIMELVKAAEGIFYSIDPDVHFLEAINEFDSEEYAAQKAAERYRKLQEHLLRDQDRGAKKVMFSSDRATPGAVSDAALHEHVKMRPQSRFIIYYITTRLA